MARRKPEPGKMESTSVKGIFRRNGLFIVRVWNPDKGKNGGRDDYSTSDWEEAKSIKRAKDEERVRRRQAGGQRFTVREWAGEPEDMKQVPVAKVPVDDPSRRPRWLQLMPRPKDSTNRHNVERIRGFVAKFGDREMPGVSPFEAQEWAREHPSTVNVIKAMLNDAKALKIIDDNPFDVVKLDKGRGRKDIKTLKVVELGELLRQAERAHGEYGRKMYAPILGFRAWTGLRPGEMYALRAEDVDLKAGLINVEYQWHSKLKKLEKLKNGLSRQVVLLDQAAEYLARVELPKVGPILTTVEGARFTSRIEHYYWDPVRTAFAAGLPDDHWLPMRIMEKGKTGTLDVYELRHFFGTELAHRGCNQYEIADQMGHLDGGKLANDTYIHIDAERARESVREKVRRAA